MAEVYSFKVMFHFLTSGLFLDKHKKNYGAKISK